MRESQKSQILARLKAGERMTTLNAMQPPLFCCRLSERIRELQKDGHIIIKRDIVTEGGARVKEYWI